MTSNNPISSPPPASAPAGSSTTVGVKPEIPAHFMRRNSRGLIEAVDMHTGRVLCMQVSNEDLLESKWERLVRIDTPQGPVWIEKGLSFDLTKFLKEMPFSNTLADLIAQDISNGKTLVEAAKALNLEYATIKRWERTVPQFKEMLDEARRERAEYWHDEVIQISRARASTKEKIAALQWGAEKGDPEKFGAKVKHSGDSKNPVTFVLSTGISRELPPVGVTPEREVPELVEPPHAAGEEEKVMEFLID